MSRLTCCLIEGGGVGNQWLPLTQAIRRFTLLYMPTDKEIQERIIAALKAKMGGTPNCPICGHNVWSVGNRYVTLSVTKNPSQSTLGGENYPLIPLICSNCGNTHLLNLLILGFTSGDWGSLEFSGDVGK